MCDQVVVVPTPEWLWSSRTTPENGVSIDRCIADQLQSAWVQGVRTLGSCCGHGSKTPSIVLTNDPDQPKIARRVLPGWQVLQWQLTDVTTDALKAHDA